MSQPSVARSSSHPSSVTNRRGKPYLYCAIDKKHKQRTLKNPHTISFFCDNANIRSYVSNDVASWSYKYVPVDASDTPSSRAFKPSHIEYRRDFKPTDMILNDTSPRLPYTGRKRIPFTGIHWGQRKLLASEVLFFLDVLQPQERYHIVYAGAACGTHIVLLMKMFKQLTFTLVDPAPFDSQLHKHPRRIKILNSLFTNTLAQSIKKKHVEELYGPLIFISDIRTEPSEDEIRKNMDDQLQWTNILSPQYALLKFRLPWDKARYRYFRGTIYHQIWQPKNSTETRLLVTPDSNGKCKMKTYDCKKYEDQLFYHNMIRRTQFHNYKGRQSTSESKWHTLHMDRCFDCVAERWLLHRYVHSKWNNEPRLTVFKLAYRWTRFLQRTTNGQGSVSSPMCTKWNTLLKRTKKRKMPQQ